MVYRKEEKFSCCIPADVYAEKKDFFVSCYNDITRGTGKLFLFAADQKIEHLNDDFYGTSIHGDTADTEHLFRIASRGSIGALAMHAGLIARYAEKYLGIRYIVKLNGKTNLVDKKFRDPLSNLLWSVDDAVELAHNSAINVCGVGYTIYVGSDYEYEMLSRAAHVVTQAHAAGLVAILWIYPRAHHISSEQSLSLIPGMCGLANSLGADFVKIQLHGAQAGSEIIDALTIARRAAGNTGILCAAGPQVQESVLLNTIYTNMHGAGIAGYAVGRNIFQRSLRDAIVLTQAISSIIYDDSSVDQAVQMLENK